VLDAVVIGGGFFGVSIACYLKEQRKLNKVCIIEREPELLSRASFNNQARIHNGYHYPRSFVTAYRSRINLPRFVTDFPSAVEKNFTKLYAIARRGSKVNARQFQRFCREIGARLEPVSREHRLLFDQRLIEAVFAVEEFAFSATALQSWAAEKLSELDVQILTNHRVSALDPATGGTRIEYADERSGAPLTPLTARYVFNCTYSGLNQLGGSTQPVASRLKHEITEIGLLDVPPELRTLGVTVMDGPYFSVMPFPARGCHSISHVRYTPHLYWYDEAGEDPYARLARYQGASRVDRMLRDAARYMPVLANAEYRESLFEVKTVLQKNEGNDGRPILFERSERLPGYYSVLGGKIDNVYDVIERLEKEALHVA
jgi:glycine/D-amino acid oxidase-like deaminating enzyme